MPDDFHVATKVHSDQKIVVERSMYWDKRVAPSIVYMRDGHSNTGLVSTGTTWCVPEGSTGGGFDSWVLISNPGNTEAVAKVVFQTWTGPAEPLYITLPPQSRHTMRVQDYVPDDFHVSTLVTSESQIVVERAMYWDKRESPGIAPYEMMGGHSASGVDL